MTTQTNQNNLPAWDLSDFYNGINDPQIDKDLEAFRKWGLRFAKKYKGKLADLTAEEYVSLFKELEKHSELAEKLGQFASLNSSTQMKNKEAMSFYQNISEKLTDYSKPTIFFSLEFNKLPQEKIKELTENKKLAFWKPWIERVRRFQPFELSEEVEEVLHEKSVTSSDAWVRLYEETSARLQFNIDGKTYNEAEISKLLMDKDPEMRTNAGQEIGKVMTENAPLFTLIYNTIIKDKSIEDIKRGFKTPISARNLSENVKDNVVKTLGETVRSRYKELSHRFYKLKAKWLGVKKIQYWDRNAPLPFCEDQQYSWDESVEIVLNAYKEFSPKLYSVAKNFFDNNWIDVPPRDGKRGGAFCSGGSAMHPYLFLNFVGKQNDVLTLAHELGHGCHHMLRIKNGNLNEYSRMTSEEIASVFGEMMTFQSLLKQQKDDKAKLCLLAGKVNDMLNTAARQIAFYFFESRAHEERRQGELSEDRLAEIWSEELKNYLGEAVVVDEHTKNNWSQVGHFFFLPFYVYAYSFADCMVNSLFKIYRDGKIKNFPDVYMEMLSKTALEDYDKLFKPFGFNIASQEFWNQGLDLIAEYLDELEKLDRKVKPEKLKGENQ